jgi:tRNA pseudouridine55 synthase
MGNILDSNKGYRATVVWGESRNTEDAEGSVTGTSPRRPDRAAILAALPGFTGRLSQQPPAFSALKVDGQRAYAAARAGKPVELKPREINVFALELVDNGPNHAVLDVFCGKGTYIRALARDIALALGTLGYLGDLRRTRAGPFVESQAISLATLEDLSHSARLEEALLPLETALDDIPALALDGAAAAKLRYGQTISVSAGLKDGIVFATSDTGPVAMVRAIDGTLKPIRVFNSS